MSKNTGKGFRQGAVTARNSNVPMVIGKRGTSEPVS